MAVNKTQNIISKQNRIKGHALELEIVDFFKKELGYIYCTSSRAASKLLDNCKVDISLLGLQVDNNPVLIQCKSGYAKKRPKADQEFEKIRRALLEHFPKDHKIHSVPKLLIHKINDDKPENYICSFMFKDFKKMLDLRVDKEECLTQTNLNLESSS